MKKSKLLRLIPRIFIVVLLLSCLVTAFAGCKKNKPVEQKINVNFVNYDGTVLGVAQVEKGKAPTYDGPTPQKPSTEEKAYIFYGWEYNGVVYEALPAVNKDTVFTASYKEVARKYTVTFIVNGISTQAELEYGEIPVYNGETQFEINGDVYEISGWNASFAPVTQDTVYIARLEPSDNAAEGYAFVTFTVDNASITEKVKIGAVPVFYGVPYRQESEECKYKFAGWSDGAKTYQTDELPTVSEGVAYVAVFEKIYKSFTVSFTVDGETVWQTQVVYGHAPDYEGPKLSKASDEKYDYTLSGWSLYDENYGLTLPSIYRDSSFEARFEKTVRNYVLSISYYADGELRDSYVQSFSYGDNYNIESPAISGYVPNAAYLSGVVTKDVEITVNYSAFDSWSGGASASFAGQGTESSPYLISTAEDLARLAEQVNSGSSFSGKYFKMTKSIDLANVAWTAIGSYSNHFAGVFDGNGYAIHNLKYSSSLENSDANSGHGLFSTVSGTVKNLSVYGSVESQAKYTGMIVGNLVGGTVEGCQSYGSVIGFGNVGGVVGLNSGNVIHCTNYATVADNGASGCYRYGGVVGAAIGSGSVTDCVNNGGVKVSAGSGYVGGVIGYKSDSVTVKNCSNNGYISNTKKYTGGVIGYAVGQSAAFEGLYNYAPISGAGYSAGIIGYNTSTVIKNCENHGLVKGTSYVAGVVCYTDSDVTNSLNVGGVIGTSTYVAGVVSSTKGSVSYCTNKGDIYTQSSTVGGVVAYIVGNTALTSVNKVTGCVNYGNVTVMSTTANANLGGVVGKASNGTLTDGTYFKPIVENCANHGIVSSNANYTGGVIGGCDGSIIRSCENYGSVFASMGTYVGGIAGSNWDYGLVTGCTNYGAIFGGSTVGEICGQLTSTSTAVGNVSAGKLP